MLKKHFQETILPELKKQLGTKNINAVPKVTKVVLNYRVPEAKDNAEAMTAALIELGSIAGQKPSVTKAKKAIASFKLRQNDPLAAKVTLRGDRMYDFLEKFFDLVLPRLRDFKGINPNAFDSAGNYSITIKDQTYFPEIDLNKVNKIRSVQVTIATTASSAKEAKMLLSALGAKFLN